jgi:hypothetical protein
MTCSSAGPKSQNVIPKGLDGGAMQSVSVRQRRCIGARSGGTSMQSPLTVELQMHQHLREQLQAEFPEADDETLRDTVEGLSRLPDVLAAILRSHLDDVAMIYALRERIGDMQERMARIEARSDRKRAVVATLMERADIKKLTEPDFTASLRPTPAPLMVIDEAKIPGEFWKPQPAKLDRRGLAAALGSGQAVAGAILGNGGVTLAVRTR